MTFRKTNLWNLKDMPQQEKDEHLITNHQLVWVPFPSIFGQVCIQFLVRFVDLFGRKKFSQLGGHFCRVEELCQVKAPFFCFQKNQTTMDEKPKGPLITNNTHLKVSLRWKELEGTLVDSCVSRKLESFPWGF